MNYFVLVVAAIIVIVAIGAVYYISVPAAPQQAHQPQPTTTPQQNAGQQTTTIAQSRTNQSSSSVQQSVYNKLSIGQVSTYPQADIKLVNISQVNGQAEATLNISSGQYSRIGVIGERQYIAMGQSGGPYILVDQVNQSGGWITLNFSYGAMPSGFSAAQSSGQAGNSSGGSSAQGQSYSGAPGNLPACGSATMLSTTPLSTSNYTSIVPMGWVSPGGHVFPSDHIYFQIAQQGSSTTPNVTVVSPGNITIYEIDAKTYSSGVSDYSIYFAQCSNVTFFMHHVESLNPKLLANLTKSKAQGCTNTTINGATQYSCQYSLDIKMKTGEKIGTIGGFQGAAEALDLGANDYRITPLAYANQSRYRDLQLHAACPIDYFNQSEQQFLYGRIGLFGVTRTAQPLCGTPEQDAVGTAQGNWFPKGIQNPYTNEGPLISLIHDNLITTEDVFSTGDAAAISGFSGVTEYFMPQSSGYVNRDFGSVATGHTYCYDSLSGNYNGTQTAYSSFPGIVLLRLADSNTLQIEYQNSNSCGSGPWNFTSASVYFYR
ncbi:MAG: hypothetical protein KGH98_04490 [Candidatus Micrarchaeota archaeon]|nr:hypothetical protein [Candidatus Micrarchaeota archaeon]